MAFSDLLPQWFVAASDVAFIPVLGAFAAWQLFVKPAARNLVFLALLLMLCAANAAYHLATYDLVSLDPLELLRNGLLVVGVIIAVVGGRSLLHARLVLWRGWGTSAEPIVWVLHAGYAWLVIALALIAATNLTPWVPAMLANHALEPAPWAS